MAYTSSDPSECSKFTNENVTTTTSAMEHGTMVFWFLLYRFLPTYHLCALVGRKGEVHADMRDCDRSMVVWLENFETFDDKANAINVVTGVNDKLAKMICDAVVRGQKLAVGKFEYQQIIEKQLEIPCMYDDLVMELMWGLKNCMGYFVPGEKLKMTKEDHLHMSQGMRIVLDRYELKVEPEMVNENIIEVAGLVYNCDRCVTKHSKSLRPMGDHLNKISNIDCEDWDLVKLATALIILCNLYEELPRGDPLRVFSKDEYSKLLSHGSLYDGKTLKTDLKVVYKEMLWARTMRNRMVNLLRDYVKEARELYEADKADND